MVMLFHQLVYICLIFFIDRLRTRIFSRICSALKVYYSVGSIYKEVKQKIRFIADRV